MKKLRQENEKLRSLLNDYEQKQSQLEDQIQLKKLISSISRKFVNSYIEETDVLVQEALAETGKFTQVDRSYLFLFDEMTGRSSCTNEWCGEGISSEIDNLQNIIVEDFPWWYQKVFSNEIILLENINDIPEENDSLREALAK